MPHFSRARPVHRYDRAETDPKRAQPRNSQGSHLEVSVVWKHLDGYRGARGEFIPRREFLVRLLQQISGISRNNVRFLLIGLDKEGSAHRFPVVPHRIQQVQRVLRPGIEAIPGKGLLERRSPVGLTSDSQQLDSQLSAGAPQMRRKLDRAAAKLNRVGIAPVDYCEVRKDVKVLSRMWVDSQRLPGLGLHFGILIADVGDRGRDRDGADRVRVNREGLCDRFAWAGSVIHLQLKLREKHKSINVIGVALQRRQYKRSGFVG